MLLAQHAINLGILVLLFFVLGMFRPKWPLFFMEKPSRWHVLSGTLIFVMIVMTMYGEGVRQDKMKKKKNTSPAKTVPAPETVPVPVPAPAPDQSGKKK